MLTREIIQRVREIQVRTGRQVADVLAGEYVSVFKGHGVEFDEVRPYVPGDDVRGIDWNVTARMGEPYVKRYVEERQLTLMLMADVSASQDFGSGGRSKREAAAEFCALLAFSAIRNDDKVGLTLFHSDIEQYIPPRKGQKHALRVVREVLGHGLVAAPGEADPERSLGPGLRRWTAGAASLQWLPRLLRRPGARLRRAREGTDISHALEFLMSVRSRKSVCFVVSDFLDEGYEKALVAANRKHDVVAVLISDPRELAMPGIGLVELRDAESGRIRVVDTASSAFRRDFARLADERVTGLERRFRGAGIDFIHIDASGSVVDPLVRFFRMRERRMRR
ncbi:MAG: DUF58 domain-containing protein [Deltaproteobacteria bacterium]|nr:DUF58 domain-containing protein [Deltaproteobacteria bacterium]MBW2416937.1 DUF58 domain-containing protein [Deltaproteobacteria bacterium]